ncbi:MAG: hypothetical protein IJT33_06670 [Campylobacter sp.]|nr:hypothetical protein [Campylobacter sp.]MBQ7270713.1 hypothetical protein [Campylobacter sp.]MBQ7676122.1 hypothetical protein [Campylobacter sp.]MBQ9876720.1 hypothetical protein [Campylobacter sp.]MBR0071710.1 hypothetical protein [Campylobacter sp.]
MPKYFLAIFCVLECLRVRRAGMSRRKEANTNNRKKEQKRQGWFILKLITKAP